jgi:hypothetical protein
MGVGQVRHYRMNGQFEKIRDQGQRREIEGTVVRQGIHGTYCVKDGACAVVAWHGNVIRHVGIHASILQQAFIHP